MSIVVELTDEGIGLIYGKRLSDVYGNVFREDED